MQGVQQPKVGDQVLFTDERRNQRTVLVETARDGSGTPLIDIVAGDSEAEHDLDGNVIGWLGPDGDAAPVIANKVPHDPKGSAVSWRWMHELNSK